MTGLLIKDIYTLLKQTKLFLLLAIALGFLQNDFLLTYVICYASMLPIAALGYDERAKWNKLADMLPYTTNELVGCKYIMGYLSIAAATFIMVFIKCFYTLIGKTVFTGEYWVILLLTICAALIIQAVNLPFMFLFGVERGRMLFIIFVVVFVLSATTALDNLNLSQIEPKLSLLISATLAITIIINLISFGLSKIAYKH